VEELVGITTADQVAFVIEFAQMQLLAVSVKMAVTLDLENLVAEDAAVSINALALE
jgi:hypothetical protein